MIIVIIRLDLFEYYNKSNKIVNKTKNNLFVI